MSETFSYDELPYPSFTFPQTRPDRLSTIGKFFGIDTALPDRCTLLELGCGDGTNLLSFAHCHPESEFVGIDLSRVHINSAISAREELGLKNVQFICADLTATPAGEFGEYDFIVAHGLFSWVPEPVREHVLKIYSECLNPNGIGYISYNAFPGFHIREITRGLMRFHTAEIGDPDEKVKQATAILGFLGESLPADSLNSKIIEREFKELVERTPSNVFHDDLSGINQAFYFHEFAEMAGRNGLQYVSEADISSSNMRGLPDKVLTALAGIGQDVVRLEQYLDFIKFRRFRSTLVCRNDLKIERSPDPSAIRNFRFASRLSPEPGSVLHDSSTVRFLGDKEESVQMNHPLTKTILASLSEVWTRSIAADEIFAAAADQLGSEGSSVTDDDIHMAESYLVEMYRVELIKLSRFEPELAHAVSANPKASDFARWQIDRNCAAVTTMTGMNLEPETDLVRLIIRLADGSRSQEMIGKEILELVEAEQEQRTEFEEQLPAMIDSCLSDLLRAGLLVG